MDKPSWWRVFGVFFSIFGWGWKNTLWYFLTWLAYPQFFNRKYIHSILVDFPATAMLVYLSGKWILIMWNLLRISWKRGHVTTHQKPFRIVFRREVEEISCKKLWVCVSHLSFFVGWENKNNTWMSMEVIVTIVSKLVYFTYLKGFITTYLYRGEITQLLSTSTSRDIPVHMGNIEAMFCSF